MIVPGKYLFATPGLLLTTRTPGFNTNFAMHIQLLSQSSAAQHSKVFEGFLSTNLLSYSSCPKSYAFKHFSPFRHGSGRHGSVLDLVVVLVVVDVVVAVVVAVDFVVVVFVVVGAVVLSVGFVGVVVVVVGAVVLSVDFVVVVVVVVGLVVLSVGFVVLVVVVVGAVDVFFKAR